MKDEGKPEANATDRAVVSKLRLDGSVAIEYTGRVLRRTSNEVMLEAIFERETMELGYVTLATGDRLVEYFYTDRWYNVFVIYARESGALKGWYCNITRPAEFVDQPSGELRVRAVDLALDYFVQPGGEGLVLDEDEFAALALEPEEAAAAWAALDALQRLARERTGPFAAG
jgi:predicted RNA-binding protein associated with RNAse of E/G family